MANTTEIQLNPAEQLPDLWVVQCVRCPRGATVPLSIHVAEHAATWIGVCPNCNHQYFARRETARTYEIRRRDDEVARILQHIEPFVDTLSDPDPLYEVAWLILNWLTEPDGETADIEYHPLENGPIADRERMQATTLERIRNGQATTAEEIVAAFHTDYTRRGYPVTGSGRQLVRRVYEDTEPQHDLA